MSCIWKKCLAVNPILTLLDAGDTALSWFVERDLLESGSTPIETLWELPVPAGLIRKQQADGSWRYRGKSYDPQTGTNYDLLETFRQLRVLVAQYGFDHNHPVLQQAVEYLFSQQTDEGDIRGILGNQYMSYYHGAILEMLILAGFDDACVERGLEWLLDVRQNDGGWIVPAQAVPSKQKMNDFWLGEPLIPDRALPFSHLATGMVLRAFAVHPAYCRREEVLHAGRILKARFFKPDHYNDRKAPAYWLKLQYPYWWTNLLCALDSLGRLGFTPEDPDIQKGLAWFLENQSEDGLWDTGYGAGRAAQDNRLWCGLAVCRLLKHYYD